MVMEGDHMEHNSGPYVDVNLAMNLCLRDGREAHNDRVYGALASYFCELLSSPLCITVTVLSSPC
jgi:hypothetical protein